MKNIFILLLFYYLTGALYITNTIAIIPGGNKVALEISSEANELLSDANFCSEESFVEFSEDQDYKYAVIPLKTTFYSNFHLKTVQHSVIKQSCNINTILNLYTNLPPPALRI